MAATIASFPPLHLPADLSISPGVASAFNCARKEDRIPQWGYQETKDFIAIRAELEKDFTNTKRNKSLWEMISSKMKERGHRRSADQCKCKWKNLYNRYKAMAITQGMETTDLDNGRPCPFYDELHAIFSESDKALDGGLLVTEGDRPGKKKSRKGGLGERSSEELSDEEEEEEEEDSEEERLMKRSKKPRKAERERTRSTAEKCRANTMQEVLEDFFQQQQRVEREWMEALQRREEERRVREQQWRETMERLEKERIETERMWREREEHRRAMEEARAAKRDALFSALLSRLAGDE